MGFKDCFSVHLTKYNFTIQYIFTERKITDEDEGGFCVWDMGGRGWGASGERRVYYKNFTVFDPCVCYCLVLMHTFL